MTLAAALVTGRVVSRSVDPDDKMDLMAPFDKSLAGAQRDQQTEAMTGSQAVWLQTQIVNTVEQFFNGGGKEGVRDYLIALLKENETALVDERA